MRRLCLVIIICLVQASGAYGYTWKNDKNYHSGRSRTHVAESNSKNDPEYDALLKKFPGHSSVIKRLYNNYSGWIIPLSKRFGITPLNAIYSAKNIDEALPVIYAYSEDFMNLYNSLETLPERVRAELSLELLLAFSITDSEQAENFHDELRALTLRDKEILQSGSAANYNARKIINSRNMPKNLLNELRESNPDEYKILLSRLSQADYETLRACAEYPNAMAFLLNTGRDGADLINKTDGQIIALSWFLDSDYHKKLINNFKTYPRLHEALKYCGADSYFTIMICPDLFFNLIGLLDGDKSSRYSMAYAVMLCQAGENNEHAEFLASLSKSDCQRLAHYAAELMNLPDDEKFFGNSLAPLQEHLFFKFTGRYGETALKACKSFSSLIDISNLFMNEWDGVSQDITPALKVLDDYTEAGLQAVIYFRGLKEIQKFILSYHNASKRETLLMFMFYDETSGHNYTSGMGSRLNAANYMLDKYFPARNTGLPAKNNSDDGLMSYVPGYDFAVPLYNFLKYGKTPSMIEFVMAANDLADLIPIVGSAYGLITKSSGKMIISNLRKSAVNAIINPINTAKNYMGKLIKSAKNLTLSEMKSGLLSVFKNTGKRSVEVVAELSLPSWKNFKEFAGFMMNKVPGMNILHSAKKVQKLYSTSLWSTERAAKLFIDEVIDNTIENIAKEKFMNYTGLNSLFEQLKNK